MRIFPAQSCHDYVSRWLTKHALARMLHVFFLLMACTMAEASPGGILQSPKLPKIVFKATMDGCMHQLLILHQQPGTPEGMVHYTFLLIFHSIALSTRPTCTYNVGYISVAHTRGDGETLVPPKWRCGSYLLRTRIFLKV